MRYTFAVLVVGWFAVSASVADDPPDPLAGKKEVWRNVLDREEFRFPAPKAGVLDSVTQYSGDCQIHLIRDVAKWRQALTIRFVREGKTVVEFDGHTESAFLEAGGVLYFLHFNPSSSGARVSAHDLTTGKKLWMTSLNALGPVQHSGYRNSTVIEEGDGVVRVFGRESYGDYAEGPCWLTRCIPANRHRCSSGRHRVSRPRWPRRTRRCT